MKQNNYYKIRHRQTGLYSTGGAYPKWTRGGKVWNNLGMLRSHLAMHLPTDYRSGSDMNDWLVVEIEMREVGIHPVHEVVTQEQLVKLISQKPI